MNFKQRTIFFHNKILYYEHTQKKSNNLSRSKIFFMFPEEANADTMRKAKLDSNIKMHNMINDKRLEE